MLTKVSLGAFSACVFLTSIGMADKGAVGPGLWSVINIEKCPEEESMPIKIVVKRHKVSRERDAFDATIPLEEPFDDLYAIHVNISKLVDGGYKPYQRMSDNSAIKFINKYAKSNAKKVMELANMDPPEFPMDKGTHEIKDFCMNYKELPPECPYGEYVATVYLLKGGMEKSCLKIHVKCEWVDDEVEDEK